MRILQIEKRTARKRHDWLQRLPAKGRPGSSWGLQAENRTGGADMKIIQMDKLTQIIKSQQQDVVYRSAMGFCPEADMIIKALDDILLLAEMSSEQADQKQVNYCVGKCQSKGEKTVARALIEYDGEQHEQSIEFFGGASKLEKIERYDQIKDQYCRENGIPLLRIRQKTGIKPLLREFIEQAKAGTAPEHESPGPAICS